MPPSWFWLKRDQEFIEVLEHYEQNNAFGNNYAHDNPLWKEISGRVKMPAPYCRKKWLVMKYTYIKLKNMIRIGRVTEEQVRMNIKTKKYLDGGLDFLDRFIWQIPDATLLTSVHRFFDSLFGPEVDTANKTHGDTTHGDTTHGDTTHGDTTHGDTTHGDTTHGDTTHGDTTHGDTTHCDTTSDVDAEKLLRVKKTSVPQVIVDFKQETGTEPMYILPEIENNVSEPIVNLETEQAIKKEYDDDSNDVEFLVEPLELHQVYLPSIQLNQTNPVGDVEEPNVSKRPKRKPRSPVRKNNIAHFLVKYANSTIENEVCDLKVYMDDLGEVLCKRLAPGKRKKFLSQIDLIVSEMLEGP